MNTTGTARALALLALSAMCACGEREQVVLLRGGSRAPGPVYLVMGTGRDEAGVFTRRIDSNIERVLTGPFTEHDDQFMVVTGTFGGLDQCRFMVFGQDGQLRVAYRPPRSSRWGEQRQHLDADQVLLHERQSRKFIVVAAIGTQKSSALIVLEVRSPRELSEHFVFWNAGTIHGTAISNDYLCMWGANNDLADDGELYAIVCAAFPLDHILAGDDRHGGSSPASLEAPDDESAPYRIYARLFSANAKDRIDSVRLSGGMLQASCVSGLRYDIDLESRVSAIHGSVDPQRPPATKPRPQVVTWSGGR